MIQLVNVSPSVHLKVVMATWQEIWDIQIFFVFVEFCNNDIIVTNILRNNKNAIFI